MSKKEKKQLVYILTKGCYSDYRIERVYLDKKEAQKYADAHNENETSELMSVETWPTSTNPEGYFLFEVFLYENTPEYSQAIIMDESSNVVEDYYDERNTRDNYVYVFFIRAKSKKHALKIASERRAMHKANNNLTIKIKRNDVKANS